MVHENTKIKVGGNKVQDVSTKRTPLERLASIPAKLLLLFLGFRKLPSYLQCTITICDNSNCSQDFQMFGFSANIMIYAFLFTASNVTYSLFYR